MFTPQYKSIYMKDIEGESKSNLHVTVILLAALFMTRFLMKAE